MRTSRRRISGGLLAAAMLATLAGPPSLAEDSTFRFALVTAPNSEAGWDRSMIAALDRVAAEPPAGVAFDWTLEPPGALERIAAEGRYDAIWVHSHAPKRVAPLMAAHPETLFVVAGDGNEPFGGNQLWVMKRLHEPSWLLGRLAARRTTAGAIGVVGTVPFADVNDQMNAFIAGARSAAPEMRVEIAFIDAWSGAGKVDAATRAMAETGIDVVFQLAPGATACADLGVACFGNFLDQPGTEASALALWDADIRRVAALWRAGPPYAAPGAGQWLGVAAQGAGLTPLPARLPDDVREEIADLRAEIASGARTVEIDPRDPRDVWGQ